MKRIREVVAVRHFVVEHGAKEEDYKNGRRRLTCKWGDGRIKIDCLNVQDGKSHITRLAKTGQKYGQRLHIHVSNQIFFGKKLKMYLCRQNLV